MPGQFTFKSRHPQGAAGEHSSAAAQGSKSGGQITEKKDPHPPPPHSPCETVRGALENTGLKPGSVYKMVQIPHRKSPKTGPITALYASFSTLFCVL